MPQNLSTPLEVYPLFNRKKEYKKRFLKNSLLVATHKNFQRKFLCQRLLTGSRPPKIIVILGPTASGKSELAVKIAKKFNGEVVSADSRQVYKGLDIGSGKVPRDSIFGEVGLPYIYKGVIHHLLDVASSKQTFTVTQYQKLAKKALKDIIKRGKIPIICGGTGLYIDSLIYDYQFPKVPPQPKLRKQLEKKSTEELFRQLKKLDPRRAKNIDKNNKRRLIRALEIVLTTKSPVPAFNFGRFDLQKINRQYGEVEPPYINVLKIGIQKTPEALQKLLIEKRLEKRLKQGMIEEVKNLRKQGISWQRLDDLGLEYRYISRYLRGLLNYEEIKTAIKKESWQYAKRQMTWFSAKGGSAFGGKRDKNIHWIEKYKEAEKLVRDFVKKGG